MTTKTEVLKKLADSRNIFADIVGKTVAEYSKIENTYLFTDGTYLNLDIVMDSWDDCLLRPGMISLQLAEQWGLITPEDLLVVMQSDVNRDLNSWVNTNMQRFPGSLTRAYCEKLWWKNNKIKMEQLEAQIKKIAAGHTS